MVTKKEILLRSALYFGVLLAADVVISLVVFVFYDGATAVVTFDYLTFVEVAFLFLAGGLYDWSQSEWSVGFRRLAGNRAAEYSRESHSEADRKAASFILSAFYFVLLAIALSL